MAFMGIFLLTLGFLLIIIGGSTLISAISFVVAIVMKSNYNNKMRKVKAVPEGTVEKPKKRFLIPTIIGSIFLVPFLGMEILFIYSFGATAIEQHTSLGYCVTNGNYERAEKLLKKGVNPDCTLESNKQAGKGEQTLLSILCENGGFIDHFEDPVDYEVTEEEIAMIRLLIKYGADIETVDYRHKEDYEGHKRQIWEDYYNVSDECGYTPLLHAVDGGYEEIVKILVEAGADTNAKGYSGYNAVHIIADDFQDYRGEEMLKYLVENGARVDEITNYGQDAIFLAERNNAGDYEWDNDGILKIIRDNLKK